MPRLLPAMPSAKAGSRPSRLSLPANKPASSPLANAAMNRTIGWYWLDKSLGPKKISDMRYAIFMTPSKMTSIWVLAFSIGSSTVTAPIVRFGLRTALSLIRITS